MGRFATDEAEASAIAGDILKFRVTDFDAAQADPVAPAMAVLCRRRAQMECIRREFEVRSIPYEIVGLGGLLDTPEIIDLVATLRVLADPGRSDSLMRLLAGARWRIGPADLMALRAGPVSSPAAAAVPAARTPTTTGRTQPMTP